MSSDKMGIPYNTDYIDRNLKFRNYLPEAIFTDVNDTVVKTEFMTPQDIAWETVRLPHFRELIKELGFSVHKYRDSDLDLILVTGNSFDYVRGRLEPYTLNKIPHVKLTISAENGLITQELTEHTPPEKSIQWRAKTIPEYETAMEKIYKFVATNFNEVKYDQGNQVRTTFKPRNIERFDREFIPNVIKFAENLGFYEYKGKDELKEGMTGIMYYHPHEALDLDPCNVLIDGELTQFKGKSYAVGRIIREGKIKYGWAFGDSKSDIPMFEEALEHGFDCFLVGNNTFPDEHPLRKKVQILERHTIGAINLAIGSALAKL